MNRLVRLMLMAETRATWRRLAFYGLAVAAGVGGLVAVKSFGLAVSQQMRHEARALMAADLVVASSRPFVAEELAALEGLRAKGGRVIQSLEFTSMARKADGGLKLVEVRAVEPGYPFYGQAKTGSGRPLWPLLAPRTALVNQALLMHLGLKVGDEISLGQGRFVIADELVSEPDGAVQLFSMGPRVLLSDAGGRATGLIGVASMVRYRALVKLWPGADPVAQAQALRQKMPDSYAVVRTFDEAQPQVNRFIGKLTQYLNLVGLVALVLGGVGVAASIRGYLAGKLDTLAMLKCLGVPSGSLLAVYLLQTAALGLLASLVGAGLGLGLQGAVGWLLADFLPVRLSFSLAWPAVAEGVALGTLTTLAFALPPLLEVRQVAPARVFRRQVEAMEPPAVRRRRLALWLAVVLPVLAGLSVYQGGSWLLGAIFFGALCGAVVLLYLAAHGLLWLLRRAGRPAGFVLRQGVAGLYRPGNQTPMAVITLGLGLLLVLSIYLVRGDLERQVTVNAPAGAPNLFFVDIQPQQRAAFLAALKGQGVAAPRLAPVVRWRIQALKGQRVRPEAIQDEELRRLLSFEYAITYRDQLDLGEEVAEGTFGPLKGYSGPWVSVAEWWAKQTGVKPGDRITLDIQGVAVEATVNSVRQVDWHNRQLNFSLVFLPGALESAPQSFVTAFRVADPARRVAVQQAVTSALPNVTSVDAEAVIVRINQIMDRIAWVVQFMAAFTIAVGLVILAGALSTTRYQRMREAALLKTLGATRWQVARALATEQALVGLLAGGVGALGAGVLSYSLVAHVFGGVWRTEPLAYLAGWLATALLTVLVGWLISWDLLNKKPLQVLREE